MIKKLTFGKITIGLQTLVFALILIAALIIGGVTIITKNNNYNTDNNSSCWLENAKCELSIPEGPIKIEFAMLPQVEEQIPLSITLPASESIDQAIIEGVNMFMGIIPVPLTQENGTWKGWFMLGSCTEPTMQWRLTLKLKDRQTPVFIYFTTTM